jgi:hypothetical protein
MAGFRYVGADYTKDGGANDLLTKADLDAEFSGASVNQLTTRAAINSAVATYASQTYVNTALGAYAQTAALTAAESLLIPSSLVGTPGGVAPLNSSGVIPTQYVPSLGAGYCLGPYGVTSTASASAVGTVPVKIADWNIGAPGTSFVPMVFMCVLASAANGGRPVVEVRVSSGQQPYANQTLVARGVGRNNWNDLQAITVLPVPSNTGLSGGSGFSPSYNLWLSAWLYDANSQSVSVLTNGIMSTAAYLVRFRQ